MTLNELGAILLEARTRHNLSVQEMADRLKLSVSTIQAIEDGNLKDLPHPAYARGFIKAYASMVGVPADLVHEALAVLVEEETPPPAPLVTRGSRISSFSAPRIDAATALRLIGLLVVMAAAAAVFWFREPIVTQALEIWHTVTDQQEASQPAALPATESSPDTDDSHSAAAPEVTLPAVGAGAQGAGTAASTGEAGQQSVAGQTDSSSSSAAAQTGAAAVTADAGQGETAAADRADQDAQNPADKPENHKLVINAVDTCWVMVHSDTAKPMEFSLRKGEGATFTFKKSLTLRLGNAGGVRLVYDGTPMASPGARGQARTLTFPPKP